MCSTLYLRSSPEGSGPAPATHHSQLPGLDGPSTTPPSSGNSCKGNRNLEISASPSTRLWGRGRSGSGLGRLRSCRAAHQIMSQDFPACSPFSLT